MGAEQSKMTQVDGAEDARHAPLTSNAPPSQLPSRPNVPTITVPPSNDPPPGPTNNPTSEPPPTPNSAQPRSRRGSFSFLRRSKSRDISEAKKESGGQRKLSRRKKRSKEEATKNQLGMPPQLPSYHNLPQMNTPFVDGVSDSRQPLPVLDGRYIAPTNASEKPASRSGYDPNAFYKERRHLGMVDRVTSPPPTMNATSPTTAGSSPPSAYRDPYERTESMTNRGRYSYASSGANGNVSSPRRVRRRKDPTPFNILVVGSKGAGKTSFVEFLGHALTRPSRNRQAQAFSSSQGAIKKEHASPFTSHYLESEFDGERVGVTIYDSNGLEKHLIDLQLREFSYFLESKFQETFREEQKVMRSAGVRDTHVHCVFFVLDPSRLDNNISSTSSPNAKSRDIVNKPRTVGAFDQDLDVDLLKTLQGKTSIIPIISKADSVTTAHMTYLKRVVWDSLKKLKMDPLEILNVESDEEGDVSEPGLSTIKQEMIEEEPKPNEEARRATSMSSVYDSAREGGEGDSGNESDSTIHRAQYNPRATNGTDTVGLSVAGLKPHHDEIRVSTMSENVELPMLPLSIISPDIHDPTVVGRRFPWGFADPYNIEHCDFTRLLDSVFSEWREDLREAARERWYEGWRTNRLRTRGNNFSSPTSNRILSSQGRTVSGASAYGGKAPESALKPPSINGASSTTSRAVSTSDIGVAVSSDGAPPSLPTSPSMPLQPKSSYRGLGTY